MHGTRTQNLSLQRHSALPDSCRSFITPLEPRARFVQLFGWPDWQDHGRHKGIDRGELLLAASSARSTYTEIESGECNQAG
ncbi:hypothetical protein EV292_11113 [Sphingomonas sp. BK235]|nr:hypothetical protein EV292_11113 [Sphingomonas sp. BK235]